MEHLASALGSGLGLRLVGALGALGLLSGYTYLVWGRASPAPLTEAEALERFRLEHAEERALAALVLTDGRTALVRTAETGRLGLVRMAHRGCVTRVLQRSDVRGVRHAPAGTTCVRLNDFAMPSVALRFASPASEAEWLGAFMGAVA